MSKKGRKKNNKSWFGAAFGLIFLIAGLWAAHISAGQIIVGYLSSANWVEVPARIHELKLVRKHEETTTYSIKSNYSYQYQNNTYNSSRVGLSTGSDNLGDYWQQLHRKLKSRQSNNNAIALVNPDDPSEALLDRTFRWEAVIFGSMFLTLFGGFGAFFTWLSLRDSPSREQRLKQELHNGIVSNQKHGSWLLGGFGAIFFIMGSGISALAVPDALRNGDYPVLLVLVFALVGAGIMTYAFKCNRAYHKLGPTPLFLDPQLPGIGGQLGGTFEISMPATNIQIGHNALQAKLCCIKKTRSKNNTYRTILWHEETSVYLRQTANGHQAQFVFNIPDTCQPTDDLSRSTSINWEVVVKGDHGPDEFERSWQVEIVEDTARSDSAIVIPANFTKTTEKARAERAKTSALNQIPINEDDEYINVFSKAGRHLGFTIMGFLFGLIFTATGTYTVLDNWWPGYIFLLIGCVIALSSLYSLGKSVEVKIDKQSRVLYTRESWMGMVYAHKQSDVLDPAQFEIKKTSSMQSGSKITEYYALSLATGSKPIRISDGIEGKKEAQALADEIIERVFQDQTFSNAA